MSSAVAELENILQSMLALKPPGVSGSKIQSITTLCTANVQNESVLIQKIYTHFKKAPGTHKLGVLYVVDSVTRQWIDAARKASQPLGSNAPDGTYAAGVNRVTELLPVLMTDIISSAPQDQKEKIKKLLDIWARGQTFPASLLDSFRDKLNSQNDTTTPTGTPPAEQFTGATQQPVNSAAAPDTSSILKALADMAKQNTTAPAAPPVVNPLAAFTPAVPQSVPSADSTSLPAANPYAVNTMTAPFSAMGLGQPQGSAANPMAPVLSNPLAAMLPQAGAGAMPDANAMAQQLQLLQMLASQGIPQDQWAAALQIFSMTNSMGGAQMPGQMPNFPMQGQTPAGWPLEGQNDRSQDRDREYNRSPAGYRRRSRSPGWDRRRGASPPRRRESPVYGEYGDSPGRRGGRRGNEYRQRSPVGGRRRQSASPPPKDPNLPPPGPKFIEWDYSIGQGCIKVLSRTLFVGGVTSSEENLRALFNQFGLVQTCIVNNEKRHAFIKMISRQDAIAARDGMETYRSSEMQLRTRWGVGFGPRDCSDYQTGVSVIPIHRLTEADTKWMLNAEYGGTGGRTIESGMVVEEPDIEIGAGVSSKAISRRIATDTGGRRGPISTRQPTERGGFGGTQNDRGFGQSNDRGFSGSNDRFGARRQERSSYDGGGRGTPDVTVNPSVPPAVPAYGFNFPGMPMLPPGFMMGGAQAAMPSTQAPAPGQGN